MARFHAADIVRPPTWGDRHPLQGGRSWPACNKRPDRVLDPSSKDTLHCAPSQPAARGLPHELHPRHQRTPPPGRGVVRVRRHARRSATAGSWRAARSGRGCSGTGGHHLAARHPLLNPQRPGSERTRAFVVSVRRRRRRNPAATCRPTSGVSLHTGAALQPVPAVRDVPGSSNPCAARHVVRRDARAGMQPKWGANPTTVQAVRCLRTKAPRRRGDRVHAALINPGPCNTTRSEI